MADPYDLYCRLVHAFNQRDWQQAQSLADDLAPVAPGHPEVFYMAGIAKMESQQLPAAIDYLRRATTLDPARADYFVQLAKALVFSRRNRDAGIVATHAASLKPSDPVSLDTLGVIFTQVGQYAPAAKVFQQAVALSPQHAPYRYNLATALIASGDLDRAGNELEACISLDPHYWLAHLALAQLRSQTPTSNHLDRLQALLAATDDMPIDSHGVMCINMALAKEHEDLANYSLSFDHLVRGKAAGASELDYSIERDEALFAAIMDCFPEPCSGSAGCPSSEPIFVIGMPRSGTTLVERIISSHPDVDSAGELHNFGMSLKHLSGSQTKSMIDVDTIARSRNLAWEKLGETYLSSTRPLTGHKPHFIDKLPHNFLYAGFIAQAFPHAKIICLRRDPMDTCLSNFRQLFGPKSPYFDYSFDLLDTGRYYVLFDRLMAHWQRMFPGRILEVNYETLVDSQEASSRELIEFCGLSWNEACLRFEDNPNPVATASAAQVRKPMYQGAVRRWKKYEPQLRELQHLLAHAGISLPA